MIKSGIYRIGEGSLANPQRWTIQATLIHGITGKPVETCDLPAVLTSLVDEGTSLSGKRYLLVDGYRYEVDESDWQDLLRIKEQECEIYGPPVEDIKRDEHSLYS